jgi:hypothetical protein
MTMERELTPAEHNALFAGLMLLKQHLAADPVPEDIATLITGWGEQATSIVPTPMPSGHRAVAAYIDLQDSDDVGRCAKMLNGAGMNEDDAFTSAMCDQAKSMLTKMPGRAPIPWTP